MTIRRGAVLVFRDDTTPEQIADALSTIIDVIDVDDLPEPDQDVSTRLMSKIETFDDEYGSPVWYIP